MYRPWVPALKIDEVLVKPTIPKPVEKLEIDETPTPKPKKRKNRSPMDMFKRLGKSSPTPKRRRIFRSPIKVIQNSIAKSSQPTLATIAEVHEEELIQLDETKPQSLGQNETPVSNVVVLDNALESPDDHQSRSLLCAYGRLIAFLLFHLNYRKIRSNLCRALK